jgi:hypothetical protein
MIIAAKQQVGVGDADVFGVRCIGVDDGRAAPITAFGR